MRIAFFGNTRYSAIDARILHEKLGLCLIITKSDKPSGRKRILTPNSVKEFALEKGIPLVEADKLERETIDKILPRQLAGQDDNGSLDFIVVADYGVILPKEVLEIPKIAPLNVHHSLLPKYRGPSPAPEVILAGETKSGVTVIKMNEQVDAGDILAQEEYTLKPNETTQTLLTKLNDLGGKLVCEVITNYESIKPQKQDSSKATFTRRFNKADGYIDINNPPDAQTLDRMVRAFYPWPAVWGKVEDKGKTMIVKFLPEGLIQPEGKRPMSLKEFKNGYPLAYKQVEVLIG